MPWRITLARALAFAVLIPGRALATDTDLNGIEDSIELALARRFCPALALHGPDTALHSNTVPVYPVPVEIMGLGGAVPGEGLPADRLFVLWRAQPLDYPYGDHWVRAMGWSPPLSESNPGHDYHALRDEPPERRQVAPPAQPSGIYNLRFHWEYGNPSVNEPAEWYNVWQDGNTWTRPGSAFPPTVYAHLRRCDAAGCGPPPAAAIFIQYWFFFPFNDWVNNHEGDWEGLNLIVSSDDPLGAALLEVEYFAHKVHVLRSAGTPLAEHCLVIDGTHPIAFVGGHGYEEGCIGGAGGGEASHGFYPTAGRFEAVGEGDAFGCFDPADEEMAVSAGPTVHWSDLEVQVIPDPAAIDTGAEPERAWLAADLLWGTRRVPSVGGELWDDVGNWAPHGPAYNTEGRWGRVAAGTDTRPYSSSEEPHPRPYRPADLGWVPHAYFLDPFSGMTANEPGDPNAWTLGSGIWTFAGGALIGSGNGSAGLTNRAFFRIDWPPTWYTLPFVDWNERAARFAADLALIEPLPDSTAAAGLIAAGAAASGNGIAQVRIVLRHGAGGGHAVEVRVRTETADTLVARSPIPDPGSATHRLEVLTLAPETGGGLFHDVWYDGALVLGSVATPGERESERGLLADGSARARFDRVAFAGLRMEPIHRHPPFAAWTAVPALGSDIYSCPQLLAWTAVDEKNDDWIAAQEVGLSTDSGATWQLLALLGGEARSLHWQPPAVPADRPGILKLTLTDVEGDSRALLSPSFWLRTGTPPATVLAPSGGEEWLRGAWHTIRWFSACRPSVDLELSTDSGTTFPHSIAIGEANDGTHDWLLPSYIPAGNRCRVRLSGGGLPPAMSPADFTLAWDGQLAGGDFEHAEPWTLHEVETGTRGDGIVERGIGQPAATPPLEGAASLWAHARAGGAGPVDLVDPRLPAGAPHPDLPWPSRAYMTLIAESEAVPIGDPHEFQSLHFELHALAVVEETPRAPAAAATTATLDAVYRDAAEAELAAIQIATAVAQRDRTGGTEAARDEVALLDPAPPGAVELRFRLRLEVASEAIGPGARAYAQAAADELWFAVPIAVDSAETWTPTPTTVIPAAMPMPTIRIVPNPAAGPVRIGFHVPAAEPVTLRLYDSGGRLVARILEGSPRPSGWNEIAWDPARLGAGTYFWQLKLAGATLASQKWLLCR
jgi:hypothetical protein